MPIKLSKIQYTDDFQSYVNKVNAVIDTVVDGEPYNKFGRYIEHNELIPVNYFGDDIPTAIATGIEFLSVRMDGALYVPANDVHNSFRVIVRRDKSNNLVTNYVTQSYRYPTGDETRPYGGSWEVGDIVLNSDIISNRCKGWICVKRGVPGKWHMFGVIKPWYSHIETVSALPEPSELQESRQLVCNSNLYFCAHTATGWKWIRQSTGEDSLNYKSVSTKEREEGKPTYGLVDEKILLSDGTLADDTTVYSVLVDGVSYKISDSIIIHPI